MLHKQSKVRNSIYGIILMCQERKFLKKERKKNEKDIWVEKNAL